MKSVIVVALFTFLLMEVSILPVYLVPVYNGFKVDTMAEYPYMCGIKKTNPDYPNGVQVCGCTIISPNYALTAAYCLDASRAPGLPFLFFAGSVNFKEGVTREIFRETDVIIHRSYGKNGGYFDFNVAIIKLNPPLNFTDNIKGIRLAGPDDCIGIDGEVFHPHDETPHYIITGWGSNNSYGYVNDNTHRTVDNRYNYVTKLLWHKALPEKHARCEELYRFQGYYHDKNICSTSPSGACSGDEGGLYTYHKSNELFLCGIIAHNDFDCNTKFTAFMRVSYYLQWICEKSNYEPEGCNEHAVRKDVCTVYKLF